MMSKVQNASPPDLLFFHATGFNAQTYAPMLALLPDTVHAKAWDLRGHGACGLRADPAQLTGWDLFARDAAAVLDANPHWPPLVLAGHSLGAVVALLLADLRPARVRALLMIDPPLFPLRWHYYGLVPGMVWATRRLLPIAARAGKRRASFPDAAAALAAYRGRGAFKTWQPGFLEAYLAGGLTEQPDGSVALACRPAWEQATFGAIRHNPWAAFSRLRAPLTLLVAEVGSTAARGLAAVRRRVPDATIRTMTGTSHFMPMEQPALIAGILADLVRS